MLSKLTVWTGSANAAGAPLALFGPQSIDNVGGSPATRATKEVATATFQMQTLLLRA